MRERIERRSAPWRIGGWSLAAALLLVPLAAMQVTDAVNWGAEDFFAAALLLFGAGLALELMVRLVPEGNRRILFALAIAGALALVWAQLAVGLF